MDRLSLFAFDRGLKLCFIFLYYAASKGISHELFRSRRHRRLHQQPGGVRLADLPGAAGPSVGPEPAGTDDSRHADARRRHHHVHGTTGPELSSSIRRSLGAPPTIFSLFVRSRTRRSLPTKRRGRGPIKLPSGRAAPVLAQLRKTTLQAAVILKGKFHA